MAILPGFLLWGNYREPEVLIDQILKVRFYWNLFELCQ